MVDAGVMVRGSFADVIVSNVGRPIGFYRTLPGLEVLVDHVWYAELGVDGTTLVAFVEAGHETVPVAAGRRPSGVLVSFEVDDAAAHAAIAEATACVFVVALTSELGQRHFMVADPDGAIVDVIERVALTTADRRRLVRLRRAGALGRVVAWQMASSRSGSV